MSEHVSSVKSYVAVFAALMVLTAATVFVANFDLGWANDVVALGIALTKAMLVLVFFMHLKHSPRATVLTAVAGFCWLAILIVMTLNDYSTRGDLQILGK